MHQIGQADNLIAVNLQHHVLGRIYDKISLLSTIRPDKRRGRVGTVINFNVVERTTNLMTEKFENF